MSHNRHSRTFFFCLLFTVVCGLSGKSFAELPPSAFTNPTRAAIDPIVKAEVDRLASASPEQWATARNSLINDGSHRDSTPTFLDVYADSVNDHLLPLTKNKDARVRLNAAIVAARIAAKADNIRLAGVTQSLLKDTSDAVVLWGLQTAKYVVPALLAAADTKTANAIAKEAVEATKDHMTPAIVEEAYRVLLLAPVLPAPSPKNYLDTIAPKDLQAFLPNAMALYEFRIALYNNVDPPIQPVADTWCSSFLITDKVWAAQSDAQKGQTLSLMLALLKGASKQNAQVSSPEMLDVMKRTGQAFVVASDKLPKKTAFCAAAHAVALINVNTAQPDIETMIGTLETAIAGLGFPAPPAP